MRSCEGWLQSGWSGLFLLAGLWRAQLNARTRVLRHSWQAVRLSPCRKDGQATARDLEKRDLKLELEEKERKHFTTKKCASEMPDTAVPSWTGPCSLDDSHALVLAQGAGGERPVAVSYRRKQEGAGPSAKGALTPSSAFLSQLMQQVSAVLKHIPPPRLADSRP